MQTARSRRGSSSRSISRASRPTTSAAGAQRDRRHQSRGARRLPTRSTPSARSKGARGPLHGIPVLVKDNYETMEMPTTAGSIALAHLPSGARRVPGRSCGRGRGDSRQDEHARARRRDHDRGLAVRADAESVRSRSQARRIERRNGRRHRRELRGRRAWAATPADRSAIPASHNNLVGLRGTQGLSSRTGIVPLSSTQDIGGPIARSIDRPRDHARCDGRPRSGRCRTTAAATDTFRSRIASCCGGALKGARIGVVRSLFGTAAEDQEVTDDRQQARWRR